MKIVISTGLSWLRVPVAINLFCKQLQAVNRQPSWSAFTKFKRDYSKYCIMYLTICYKSSSFAQFIQKWTVLSQNFWLYWTFFVKFGNFWLNQSFLKKIGHFRLNWAFWLKAQFCKIQNIAKCTISTFKCTKKFQNTPVKIYRTSDRTYVPKKNRVSLYFWFTTLWMNQIIRLIGSWLNIERSSRSWHLALRTYGG